MSGAIAADQDLFWKGSIRINGTNDSRLVRCRVLIHSGGTRCLVENEHNSWVFAAQDQVRWILEEMIRTPSEGERD
jgi:hypothetical protein